TLFPYTTLFRSVGKILFLLLECFRLVWNRTAFDDAATRSNGVCCTELIKRARRGRVGLDVPIGFIHRLPDTVQVRLAVLCPGRPVGRCLSRSRRDAQKQAHSNNHRTYKTSSHSISIPSK